MRLWGLKVWVVVLGITCAVAGGRTLASPQSVSASSGAGQLPIWPGTPPDAQPVPGPQTDGTNIVRPTMTVYSPQKNNTGVAVVVFPGGGFEGLAIKGEGTDACDWLTSEGITCVLLRYRVPTLPYDWHCKCRPDNRTTPTLALEDAQRTMGLIRYQATRWHVDPHKIGCSGSPLAVIWWRKSVRATKIVSIHRPMPPMSSAVARILRWPFIRDICGLAARPID
jgi:acetyl esterase/lipase